MRRLVSSAAHTHPLRNQVHDENVCSTATCSSDCAYTTGQLLREAKNYTSTNETPEVPIGRQVTDV